MRFRAGVEHVTSSADVFVGAANAGDAPLVGGHAEPLVPQPQRLGQQQGPAGSGVGHGKEEGGELGAGEQRLGCRAEGDRPAAQGPDVLRYDAHHQERHGQHGEEPEYQADLESLQGVVDDLGCCQTDPDEGQHGQGDGLPWKDPPGGGGNDVTGELGRLRRPAGPEEADEGRPEEKPGPYPPAGESGHAAEHRFARGDGPPLDLLQHHELRHDPDPEQPPNRESVDGYQIGPQQKLAGAQSHAERDNGWADQMPQSRNAGDFLVELERWAVASMGEFISLGRVWQGGVVEWMKHARPVFSSSGIGTADLVIRRGLGHLDSRGKDGSANSPEDRCGRCSRPTGPELATPECDPGR